MYLQYYGLDEKPFNITPDVHFLFPSAIHREALTHLMFGIEGRRGFILLSGEVGAGKTTICRALLNQIRDDTKVALVFNTFLTELELLKTINEDLGIKSAGTTKKELIDELNAFLLKAKEADRNVVIIIDEAQNLLLPVLEEIRMLGNLETAKDKLVQIVLVGQPEVRKLLESPELKQLNQRISVRYHLRNLSRGEVEHYIYYRLRVAGSRGDIIFSKKALNKLYSFSGGIPRLINVICDHCLLIGYVDSTRDITDSIVVRAYKEVFGSHRYSKKTHPLFSKLKTAFKIAAGVVILLGFVVMAKLMLPDDQFGFLDSLTGGPEKTESGSAENATARAKTIRPGPRQARGTDIKASRLKAMAIKTPSLLHRAINAHKTGYLGATIGSTVATAPEEPQKGGASPNENSVELVRELLNIWKTSPKTLEVVAKSVGDEFDPETDLVYIYELADMGSVLCECDVPFLLKINTPAIIEIKDGDRTRYALLRSVEADKVLFQTAGQRTTTDPDKLGEIFTGRAVFVADSSFINPMVLHDKLGVSLEVRRLQELLKEHSVFDGNQNGLFNTQTRDAVIQFQRAQLLAPSGMADVKTKLMLYFLRRDINVPRLR